MTYAKLPKILAINNKTFIFCYTINIINIELYILCN